MINYITNWTLKQQRKKWALKQPKKKPTTCQPSIVFYIYLPGRTASADWLIYVIHVINQIKSNNFYWSKNPNKGLSSIHNMTNTTKTTLSTQYLITHNSW